jgi:hypothetical protein
MTKLGSPARAFLAKLKDIPSVEDVAPKHIKVLPPKILAAADALRRSAIKLSASSASPLPQYPS